MKRMLAVLLFLSLTACELTQAAPPPQPSATATFSPAPPSPTSVPTATDTPSPTPSPAPKFPPEPQRIEFQAEDGQTLVGYYYPAAVEPAPVVVLLHWVAGTHCDWVGVSLAQWLQHRGLPEGMAANPDCAKTRLTRASFSLSEYPPLDGSYAVFAVNYRGLDGGRSFKLDLAGWLKDSKAAMQKARELEGVDPNRVAGIGASIGADGVADACGEGCVGALSLSPGNYLGIRYADAVKMADKAGKPVWCVAARPDRESFPTCESAGGTLYQKFIYEKDGHGLEFFSPGFEPPKISQIIFDFLQTVFK